MIELYSNCERETEIYRLNTTTWATIPKRCTGSKEATFQRIVWAIYFTYQIGDRILDKKQTNKQTKPHTHKTVWLLEEKTGIPTLQLRVRDWTSLEEH